MCRWIAYAGPEIFLEDLLFHQENSIVRQSLSARESVFTTNGDGFGVAWYGKRTAPGLFMDTLPAWNDSNLRSLAAQCTNPLLLRPCSRLHRDSGKPHQLPSVYLEELVIHA